MNSKEPRYLHRDHHLSVRQGIWNTYIVCEECGQEYETAWNKLLFKVDFFLYYLVAMPLSFLFFDPIYTWRETFTGPEWLLQAIVYGAVLLGYLIFHILLNCLQAFILRRSDDLASHIF